MKMKNKQHFSVKFSVKAKLIQGYTSGTSRKNPNSIVILISSAILNEMKYICILHDFCQKFHLLTLVICFTNTCIWFYVFLFGFSSMTCYKIYTINYVRPLFLVIIYLQNNSDYSKNHTKFVIFALNVFLHFLRQLSSDCHEIW